MDDERESHENLCEQHGLIMMTTMMMIYIVELNKNLLWFGLLFSFDMYLYKTIKIKFHLIFYALNIFVSSIKDIVFDFL